MMCTGIPSAVKRGALKGRPSSSPGGDREMAQGPEGVGGWVGGSEGPTDRRERKDCPTEGIDRRDPHDRRDRRGRRDPRDRRSRSTDRPTDRLTDSSVERHDVRPTTDQPPPSPSVLRLIAPLPFHHFILGRRRRRSSPTCPQHSSRNLVVTTIQWRTFPRLSFVSARGTRSGPRKRLLLPLRYGDV